ncbi:MAG: transposase [Opitutales bacterium]|nr:transposase [Opitutales bacterium]
MSAPHFTPFNPWEEIDVTRRRLPHWQQSDATYFVTFRLGDSIPQEKLALWKAEREQWLGTHPEPWDETTVAEYSRLFPGRRQQWLDNGYGSRLLRKAETADIVRSALKYFDGERYRLDAFVLMPNHVHVLVKLLGEHGLSSILHSWKSYTAKQINRANGTSGSVWQDESYDHIVRSAAQLNFFRTYIRENPAKAGLDTIQAECGTGVPSAEVSQMPREA